MEQITYSNNVAHSSILTANEVAQLLRVNTKTVYDAFKNGDLPGFRIGRSIRFHRENVLSLLGQVRVVPKPKEHA